MSEETTTTENENEPLVSVDQFVQVTPPERCDILLGRVRNIERAMWEQQLIALEFEGNDHDEAIRQSDEAIAQVKSLATRRGNLMSVYIELQQDAFTQDQEVSEPADD